MVKHKPSAVIDSETDSHIVAQMFASHFQQLCITRNSSGDEIASVNLLYHDIVHAIQYTKDSCINSATDRRGCVETHVYQIQRNNAM